MTSYRVTLARTGAGFDAAADRPVLLSAERAGVALPNSCRNGTCRTCLCQLAAGSVRYAIDWPGVSREERAAGWMLPCVAHPCSDLLLR